MIYYIDQNGSNTSAGTIQYPWKTLAYACSRPMLPGDVIFINDGTYIETTQSILKNGVSIQGQSKVGVQINSTYSAIGEPLIKLETANGWTLDEGHQSISNLSINGSLTTHSAIAVRFRHYVDIHDCSFNNFLDKGVVFYGCSARTNPNPHITNTTKSYYRMPDAYAKGNRFTDNILTNCARYTGTKYNGNGHGNLEIGAQDGIIISGNTITQTGRAALMNGYGIKFHDEGYNKNCEISNNIITVGFLDSTVNWEFAIEWWNSMGGDSIFSNRISGALDIVNAWDHHTKGFAINIYDNNIGRDSTPATQERGILLEGAVEYVNIFRNHIHHVGRAIYIPRQASPQYTGQDRLFHVDISVNLMVSLGQSGSQYQTWGIQFNVDTVPDQSETQYFYVRNNVIEAVPSLVNTFSGVILPHVAEMSHIYIENNIILNFDYHAIYGRYPRTKATDIYIRNNIAFGNGNNNDPIYKDGFPTGGIIYTPNIKLDPMFKGSGDYHLTSVESPAYHAGFDANIINDYDNKPFHIDTPSIGAYELITEKDSTTINFLGKEPVILMSKPPWVSIKGNGIELSVGSEITDGIELSISDGRIGLVVLDYDDELMVRTSQDDKIPSVEVKSKGELIISGEWDIMNTDCNYITIGFEPSLESVSEGTIIEMQYEIYRNGIYEGQGLWQGHNKEEFSTDLLLTQPVMADKFEVIISSI